MDISPSWGNGGLALIYTVETCRPYPLPLERGVPSISFGLVWTQLHPKATSGRFMLFLFFSFNPKTSGIIFF